MMLSSHVKIGVRRLTKEKLGAVACAKDWSYATTVDKAAEALAEKEGISIPQGSARQQGGRKPRRPAA